MVREEILALTKPGPLYAGMDLPSMSILEAEVDTDSEP